MDASIFGRHLDLDPLGGRHRGLVRCRFHQDDTASLSVDLERGLFHCFGCGQQGGLKRFAALVGELDPAPSPEPPTTEPPTVWLEAMRLAKRQPWRRPGVLDVYAISDFIRRERQRLATIRRAATDTDAGWESLGAAADAERYVNSVEGELDAMLQGWHL